jgi:tol-pal system protein YbgF
MRYLLSLLFCLAGAGCFYPAARGRSLEAKVDRLAADSAEQAASIKQSQERLAASLPRLDEKIAQVTAALDSLDKASRRTGADTGVQLQKTVEDVAQLRGQVETYLHKLTELEDGIQKLNESNERRQEGDSKSFDAKKRAEDLNKPNEPKPFLALADEKAKDGDTALARQLYSEFLKKWPKDDLVPSAHLGLGEALVSDDKCPEALYEFGQVATKYPKSKAAPDALLLSSDCFRKSKDYDNAKAALEEILASYPRSSAAKPAKAKLAELEKLKKPSASKKGKR